MNKSLQEKRAARLAAVQALYNRSVMSHKERPAERFIDDMLLQWEGLREHPNSDWQTDLRPNRALLTKLVQGVLAEEETLRPFVEQVIKDNWKPERMSPIIVAALNCAAFELKFHPDTKAPIIVDEYTSLVGEFFDEPELAYSHSAIHQLMDVIRPKTDA